jgi:hypothetical protein
MTIDERNPKQQSRNQTDFEQKETKRTEKNFSFVVNP